MLIQGLDNLKLQLQLMKPVVIVTHWSPDGDAMGSSLAMYSYLLLKGHSVSVVTPNDYPDFLKWMPGNENVVDFSDSKEKAKALIAAAGIIFCLDFNSLKRVEELGGYIAKSNAFKCMIDHHPAPEAFADFVLHDVGACSTAELVHEFIGLMGDKQVISKDIANCLYAGIMTDTGSFRFPSTTAKTHRIVADLVDAGAQNWMVHQQIYDTNTSDRLKLIGYSLFKKFVILKEFSTAYIHLSETELKEFNFKKGDTEGLVNYGLSIEGIIFSAFFVERDGMIKASFRSKGNFDVNSFARKNFNGGGHKNAAGGSFDKSLDDAVVKFRSVLPEYKDELNKK